MSYTKTNWRNDTQPPINASNLNKIEQGIYDAHETVDPIAHDFPLYKSNTNALMEDMDEAQSDITTLQTNVSTLQTDVTEAQSQLLTDAQYVDLASLVSKEYDPTADYFVGEFCTNLNKVWKCKTDIVGGETWDATHWDEVMSVEDLYTMLKNLASKGGTATEFDPITDAEIDEMFGTAAGTGTNAQDYVIEHGTSTVGTTAWTYRKWASGLVECWGDKSVSITINQKWGSLYYGEVSASTYPFTFKTLPLLMMYFNTGSSWCTGCYDSTTTKTGHFYTMRPESGNVASGHVYYYVRGEIQ